ncbi:MAG: CDP-alcohol phosphatidyltransferase family protein [Chromatiales bacterium]|nr:CDP-alcohol phosphatidyltransferase family protein [Chromatiales bacterium]
MTRRDIPNLISIARILLVAPIVWLMAREQYGQALMLFAVAGISDGLDGFLAKHYGWQSRLGSILDPLADKLLLVCTFVTLAWQGILPVWLAVLVVLRDVVIVVGGVTYHFRIQPIAMADPTYISKANTALQIALVLAAVLDKGLISLPEGLLQALIWLTAASTLASGIAYVLVWGRKAAERVNGR